MRKAVQPARFVSFESRRSYARSSKPAAAQPISIPQIDSAPSGLPPPAPSTRRDADNPARIHVPTSSDHQSQLVTVTLRKRALDIDSPAYGFSKAVFPYVWLRDVCTSRTSVDQDTKQKFFKFEDVDKDIKPKNCRVDEQTHELLIEWDRPLKGKQSSGKEESTYKLDFLRTQSDYESWRRRYRIDTIEDYKSWDAKSLSKRLLTIPYEKLHSPAVIEAAISALFRDGFAIIKNVPTDNRAPDTCSLVEVANRFGNIMPTWYGDKTFSVRSHAGAKNIAYTSLHLDLHMDLLHFHSPPRYQFLHCLHLDPSVQGGVSYFVDAYKAAELLQSQHKEAFDILCREKIGFEYKNDGHWTYAERPTLELHPGSSTHLSAVNYSPPFQAPLRLHPTSSSTEDPTIRMQALHEALEAYSKILDDPDLRLDTKLQPGDCVVFDNRRLLHARTAFGSTSGEGKGEVRWLVGCYVDETSVRDKFRMLGEAAIF